MASTFWVLAQKRLRHFFGAMMKILMENGLPFLNRNWTGFLVVHFKAQTLRAARCKVWARSVASQGRSRSCRPK